MLEGEYEHRLAVEDRHWYFRAKRSILDAVARGAGVRGRILDMGCGTGGNHALLAALGQVFAFDASPRAIDACQRRGISKLVRGDAGSGIPFVTGSFDAVFAIDVLEHVDDDSSACREIARVLKPGGVAVVTAPAFRSLWSDHDVAAQHRRRYRRAELAALALAAGLQVERSTYFNSFLFPLVAVTRIGRRWFGGAGAVPATDVLRPPPPRPIADLFSGLLAFERHFLARGGFPFGVTALCVARRGWSC